MNTLQRIDRLHAAGHKVLAVHALKAGDYFDRIGAGIRRHIIGQQGEIWAERLPAVLDAVSDPVSLAMAITRLEEDLQTALPNATRTRLERYLSRSYLRGQVDIRSSADWEFSRTDEDLVAWLSSDASFWVGQHWGDQVTTTVRDTLTELGSVSREQKVRALRESMTNLVRRSDGYWSNLSNHITTRARSFGVTEGLVAVGARRGIFDAINDDRTSDVCRYMDGKEVLVQDMVALRQQITEAASPEAIRNVQDWKLLTAEEVESRSVAGRPPVYASLPPLHFGCRSHIVFIGD